MKPSSKCLRSAKVFLKLVPQNRNWETEHIYKVLSGTMTQAWYLTFSPPKLFLLGDTVWVVLSPPNSEVEILIRKVKAAGGGTFGKGFGPGHRSRISALTREAPQSPSSPTTRGGHQQSWLGPRTGSESQLDHAGTQICTSSPQNNEQ